MSSTNHTANYGLSQFLGTDKPAWLVDYNGDMSAIDTQMKANADAAAAAQSTANTADGKADTNASAINTLDTQINGVSGIAADVTTLQGSVNTITSLIGNGEPTTTDKTLIGAINEINAELTGFNLIDLKVPSTPVDITAYCTFTGFSTDPTKVEFWLDGLNDIVVSDSDDDVTLAGIAYLRVTDGEIAANSAASIKPTIPNSVVFGVSDPFDRVMFNALPSVFAYPSAGGTVIISGQVHNDNSQSTLSIVNSTASAETFSASGTYVPMHGWTRLRKRA